MSPVPAFALNPLARPGFVVMKPDFNAIERFIRDNKESKVKVQIGIDLLVRTMVLVIKGEAQSRSMGPIAPHRRSVPALAYRIPVQRITGAYFAGWQIRRMAFGRWLVFNDSKEAYLIENGIYMRARRPILKLSLIAMLKFLENSRTEQRFLDSLIKPRRNALGQFAAVPFEKRLNTPTIMGLTASDLPNRGINNPHTRGPTGTLPA